MPIAPSSSAVSYVSLALALAGASGCIVVADDVAGTESASATGSGTDTEAMTSSSASSTSVGTGTAGTSTAGTTTEGTTTEGTTTEGTTTEGTTTEGTTTEGTTGVEVCEPGPGVAFEVELVPAFDDFIDLEVTYLCEILSVGPKGDQMIIETACSDGDEPVVPSPSVIVTADPPTALAGITPGMTVSLRYGQFAPWWTETWLRIETVGDGALLLAAATGASVGSQGEGVFAPISIGVQKGLCAANDDDFCGVVERVGLAMQVDAEPATTVLDSEFAIIGGDPGLSVWVRRATHYIGELQCTDTPSSWYSLGVVFDGME